MARPVWQIEVPMSCLSFEEKAEVEEKLSVPLDPEAALEAIEEAADIFDLEVVIRLRDMHMSGVRITMSLASQISQLTKENENE